MYVCIINPTIECKSIKFYWRVGETREFCGRLNPDLGFELCVCACVFVANFVFICFKPMQKWRICWFFWFLFLYYCSANFNDALFLFVNSHLLPGHQCVKLNLNHISLKGAFSVFFLYIYKLIYEYVSFHISIWSQNFSLPWNYYAFIKINSRSWNLFNNFLI